MVEHQGCAYRSRERDESMLGTASTARRWLLVEQPGPWGHDALVQSAIPSDVAHRLQALARKLRARPVLLRRPSTVVTTTSDRQAFLVQLDAEAPQVRQLTFTAVGDLLVDLGRAVDEGLTAVGQAHPGPLVLVCTHGRHDTCCALEGRPAAAALAEVLDDVWECSHVGGDRFAANVVVLPHGVYYGRVGAADAAQVAADVQAGRVSLEHYRGRSLYPFPVQAAEALLRRECHLVGLEAVQVLDHGEDGDGQVWVRMQAAGQRWTVVVAVERSTQAHLLTCRAQRASHPPGYRLLSAGPEDPTGHGRTSRGQVPWARSW